jgi:hypothetical protein
LSSPSKLYEESGKVKVSVRPGRRLEKLSKEALADSDKFWAGQARNLAWFKEWDRVLEWSPPFARWFTGGLLIALIGKS